MTTFGFADALKMCDNNTEVYPIWLCPACHYVHKGLKDLSMLWIEYIYVDVGLYG